MIKIDSSSLGVSAAGYSTSISGNGGEEEFVVMGCIRQDGRASFLVLRGQVDGMCTVIGEFDISAKGMIVAIGELLIKWVLGGIPPTEDEHTENFDAIKEVLQNMIDHYCLKPTSLDWLGYEYLKQSRQ